jgi:hypothetical protein
LSPAAPFALTVAKAVRLQIDRRWSIVVGRIVRRGALAPVNGASLAERLAGTGLAHGAGKEITMKTLSALFFLSSLTFGCASTRLAGSRDVVAPQHGDELLPETAMKAIVAGPIAIHAYSAVSGGTIFVADNVTGTDRDCQLTAPADAGDPLPADHVQSVTVGAGKIACIAATSRRGIEILWHTLDDAPRLALFARNQ